MRTARSGSPTDDDDDDQPLDALLDDAMNDFSALDVEGQYVWHPRAAVAGAAVPLVAARLPVTTSQRGTGMPLTVTVPPGYSAVDSSVELTRSHSDLESPHARIKDRVEIKDVRGVYTDEIQPWIWKDGERTLLARGVFWCLLICAAVFVLFGVDGHGIFWAYSPSGCTPAAALEPASRNGTALSNSGGPSNATTVTLQYPRDSDVAWIDDAVMPCSTLELNIVAEVAIRVSIAAFLFGGAITWDAFAWVCKPPLQGEAGSSEGGGELIRLGFADTSVIGDGKISALGGQ
jgi:hypothetical protein